MKDLFDLQRFIDAQDAVYSQVLQELRAGKKRTHWIWFILPQLKELGSSHNAQLYGIASLDEATAYLAHPVLGPRLQECCKALLAVEGRSAYEIMGSPDDLKLRSSLTLFERAAGRGSVFLEVLAKFFDGHPDPRTIELLA